MKKNQKTSWRAERRRLFRQIIEWSIGITACRLADKTGYLFPRAECEGYENAIELGRAYITVVWTGSDLLGVESVLDYDERGMVLWLGRAVCVYRDEVECVEAGRDMVEFGARLVRSEGLRFRVDISRLNLDIVE